MVHANQIDAVATRSTRVRALDAEVAAGLATPDWVKSPATGDRVRRRPAADD